MTERRRPAAHHLLACYILFRMKQELAKRGLIGNLVADHRQQFENIMFLVGEELRTGPSRFDLGLHTVFHSVMRTYLVTVKTVLEQCIEQGWMQKPSPESTDYNYRLSNFGGQLVDEILRNDGVQMHIVSGDLRFLDQDCRSRIDHVILRWLGQPPERLKREIQQVAGRAFIERRVVPHYDIRDSALKPFLEGFAARQADQASKS